jgi:hypothetical protein
MKKTNEAWFGDTFDRPSTIACYTAKGEHLFDGRISACDLSYSPDSYPEVSITCDLANTADSIGYAFAKNASINQVENLSDKIRDIQAQLHDLRKSLETKKENSELRSALKTLHYKREVE